MDNRRGALLMVASMAGFAFEDLFIKLLSDVIPVGQLLIILGFGGFFVFWALLLRKGRPMWTRDLLHPAVVLRNMSEMLAVGFMITALARTTLSGVTAIMQALPLVVVLGAALFLREQVGWRRWSAVSVGLIGMMLIVQPGMGTFDPNSVLAVIAVVFLASRDLATRRVPTSISSLQISAAAFLSVVPAGAAIWLIEQPAMVVPSIRDWLVVMVCIAVGVVAYMLIVSATRIGEASAIAPFRYSRMVFGMGLGVLILGERPDLLTLIGAAIIMGAGIYTFVRETRVNNVR